jgi:branched-chain amino acid transport system permease protein
MPALIALQLSFLDKVSLLPQAVFTGLLMGLIYALVAVGLALIWGVADIVNFAYGEYMLIGMYVTLVSANGYGVDPLLVIPLNIIILFIAGYVTYKTVIIRVMDAPMLSQIFVTFGILLILRFGLLFLAGPNTQTLDAEEFLFSGAVTVYGFDIGLPELVTAIISVVTLAIFFLFLNRTKTGKGIRATAQDPEAARVMGIDPDYMNALTWGIGTATVGVAGTMVATFFPVQPELTPTTWTLFAFASVALGGFGNVLGAVAGGIVIGLVEHVGAILLDPSFKELYVFVIFIGVLLLKPEGILNWGERRP